MSKNMAHFYFNKQRVMLIRSDKQFSFQLKFNGAGVHTIKFMSLKRCTLQLIFRIIYQNRAYADYSSGCTEITF